METQDILDGLLSTSASCLEEIEAGRFEDLEEIVIRHNQSLMNYMQGKEIHKLAKPQQEKLYQLLMDQNAAVKIISEQKQQLSSKLTELRNGRHLKSTYKDISL